MEDDDETGGTEEVVAAAPATAEPPTTESSSLQKKARRFRPEWKTLFSWVDKFIATDGEEVMKCAHCCDEKQNNIWAREGCRTMQRSALQAHAYSADHKYAAQKRLSRVACKPLREHVVELRSALKDRIHTTMKLMLFVARQDWAISSYEDLCKLAQDLTVPNMPVTTDYGTYISGYGGFEFLSAISAYLMHDMCSKVRESPFFSVLIDESTDRALEKHLVIYIMYLSE